MPEAASNLENKKRGRPRREAPPDQIKEMRIQGLSFRAIARKTGLGYGTVRRAYWAAEAVGASAAD
jgi:DNA invertase Pin-like site-specific DNA recombinase